MRGNTLVALLACAVLAACGGEKPASEADVVEEVTEAVVVVQDAVEDGTEAAATLVDTSELAGTGWQLVKIQSMDDSVAEPDSVGQFTITFGADGRAAMKVDCNRGNGEWQSSGPGSLTFGPVAATRAMCGPNSLDSRFLKELEFVRTYVFRDGNLYLATMADGSILEFVPL